MIFPLRSSPGKIDDAGGEFRNVRAGIAVKGGGDDFRRFFSISAFCSCVAFGR